MNRKLIINIDNLILIGIGLSAVGVAISYADIYLFHVWFLLLGSIWFIQLRDSKYLVSIKRGSNIYMLFLFYMFFWYGITIIWTPDFIYGIKYLFYIFCGIIITNTIIQFSTNVKQLNKIYNTLCIIFIIELIVSLLESFSFFRWPISPYSSWYTFFGKEKIDFLVFDMLAYSNFSPPTGFHWNTNNLAITMVMILPFFLCKKKISIKLIGSICITLITILTSSRAVFLALIFIFFLYLILIKKRVFTLILIWLVIMGIFTGMNILKESQNPRLNEVANSLQALELYLKGDLDIGGSLEWRRELINNGMLALLNTNGLGVGAGGSTAIQEKLGGVDGRFTSMHNFWIEIIVEGGIIFALFGLFWYLNITYNLLLISKKKVEPEIKYYAQSLFLSMVGFIPAAVSASSTIYFFPMWIMFGFSIAVIGLNRKKQNLKINY